MKLELEPNEVQYIINILAKTPLPYIESNNIINKLGSQFQKETQKPVKVEKEEPQEPVKVEKKEEPKK